MTSPASLPEGKYPAKEHARRVVEYLQQKGAPLNKALIYLEAQHSRLEEDNDHEAPFRQRRYFYYLSGCNLADASLVYDVETSALTLFIPPIDEESVVWSGLPMLVDEAQKLYDVDEVKTTDELNSFLEHVSAGEEIYAIKNQISGHVRFPRTLMKNLSLVKEAIDECRVCKDAYEVALIQEANRITAVAHDKVMKAASSAANERELYALFLQTCISHGFPEQAYHGIFASGTHAATLHYTANNRPLEGRQLLLLDAAAEFHCYAADVTRTFPINGSFTPEARAIYDLVLEMQLSCLGMLKEGVRWEAVHENAHKVAIKGLLDLGIFRSGSVEDILNQRTSVGFFPHGLGHYLGMDTHDTGGHANYQDKDKMFSYLRVRGTLPKDSVITVEPGIYFNRRMLDPYLGNEEHSRFIDKAVLDRYWDVGGVRIEDDVLITASGYDNLTSAPKKAEELERSMIS